MICIINPLNVILIHAIELSLAIQMKLYQPAIVPLLQSFADTGHVYQCPPAFQRFLTALASDKAVCAIIPPTDEIKTMLEEICDGVDLDQNPHYMQQLQLHIPCVYDLLAKVQLTQTIKTVLLSMVKKANQPFQDRQEHKLPPPDSDNDYYPRLPKRCARGSYVLDSQKSVSKDCAKDEVTSKRHKTLTPGLFVLSCPCG